MNNNSIQINSYLQNEMSAAERTAFEQQLASNAELRYELEVQRNVISFAVHAGMKGEFAKAISQKIVIRRIFKTIIVIVSIAVITIFIYRKNIFTISNENSNNIIAQKETLLNTLFVNPPIKDINVPFSEYSVEAEKGDTIFYGSGSIILLPPSAFLDASGNIIKGNVKIHYREFADPIDFFVSGIPMQYDSAGRKYDFESSGMCEITAYKDDKPVFVNPQAKPEINLSSRNKDPLHNLYFLDTANRRWEFKGKDVVTINNTKNKNDYSIASGNGTVGINSDFIIDEVPIQKQVPIKPIKASDDHQSFSIAIDPGSFQELFNYDGLKFEVVDESTYKRSDANEHWDNVKLDRTDKEGIYMVTFKNPERKVSYKVRPVLDGADYDAALKVFNEKSIAYQQALKRRKEIENLESDSIATVTKRQQKKMIADEKENNEINALIITRNKRLREFRKKQTAEFEKQLIASSNVMQDLNLQIEKELQKYASNMSLTSETMQSFATNNLRSFAINNFGTWNCDRPRYPDNQISIYANFIDNENNIISFPTLSVVTKDFNGLKEFSSAEIRVTPGFENMIWSIVNKTFYYFSYNDFIKSGINKDSKAFTFKMRSSGPILNYGALRTFLQTL